MFFILFGFLLLRFHSDECAHINWGASSNTFPKFTRLLKEPTFSYCVLLGLTVSVGGLTESLVSCANFTNFVQFLNRNFHKFVMQFSHILCFFEFRWSILRPLCLDICVKLRAIRSRWFNTRTHWWAFIKTTPEKTGKMSLWKKLKTK